MCSSVPVKVPHAPAMSFSLMVQAQLFQFHQQKFDRQCTKCLLDVQCVWQSKTNILDIFIPGEHEIHIIYIHVLYTYIYIYGDRGGIVVKVLCHKSEGRWFDPRWSYWNFSLT